MSLKGPIYVKHMLFKENSQVLMLGNRVFLHVQTSSISLSYNHKTIFELAKLDGKISGSSTLYTDLAVLGDELKPVSFTSSCLTCKSSLGLSDFASDC